MQKHNDGDLMAPEGTGRQAEIGQDQKREKNCLERGLCVWREGNPWPCGIRGRMPGASWLDKSVDGVQDRQSIWKGRGQIWGASTILFLDVCGSYTNICFRKVIEPHMGLCSVCVCISSNKNLQQFFKNYLLAHSPIEIFQRNRKKK